MRCMRGYDTTPCEGNPYFPDLVAAASQLWVYGKSSIGLQGSTFLRICFAIDNADCTGGVDL